MSAGFWPWSAWLACGACVHSSMGWLSTKCVHASCAEPPGRGHRHTCCLVDFLDLLAAAGRLRLFFFLGLPDMIAALSKLVGMSYSVGGLIAACGGRSKRRQGWEDALGIG